MGIMKKILMIAYHYPPSAGSSGIQRTLKFTQYLPEFGWQPLLLTVKPMAYAATDQGQMSEIPDDMILWRSLALDAAQHLSIYGKYLGLLALPDRWMSWILSAIPAGLYLIKKHRPAAIWSTYPIASAHLIGLILTRISGLPWIADFRDSMTEENYPLNRWQWKVYRTIESKSIQTAQKSIFTTPGALTMYSKRYPHISPERFGVIENAFDEENFRAVEIEKPNLETKSENIITLLHSGILYPSERDPRPFFRAIAAITRREKENGLQFRVILRATGHDEVHREAIKQAGVAGIVLLKPAISYHEAIAEMLASDVLVLFQAANCNHQIPAKIYEYIRAQRPILALTDPQGDTAGILQKAGIGQIIPLNDQRAIERQLPVFLAAVKAKKILCATKKLIERNTRKMRTYELCQVLSTVTSTKVENTADV